MAGSLRGGVKTATRKSVSKFRECANQDAKNVFRFFTNIPPLTESYDIPFKAASTVCHISGHNLSCDITKLMIISKSIFLNKI